MGLDRRCSVLPVRRRNHPIPNLKEEKKKSIIGTVTCYQWFSSCEIINFVSRYTPTREWRIIIVEIITIWVQQAEHTSLKQVVVNTRIMRFFFGIFVHTMVFLLLKRNIFLVRLNKNIERISSASQGVFSILLIKLLSQDCKRGFWLRASRNKKWWFPLYNESSSELRAKLIHLSIFLFKTDIHRTSILFSLRAEVQFESTIFQLPDKCMDPSPSWIWNFFVTYFPPCIQILSVLSLIHISEPTRPY